MKDFENYAAQGDMLIIAIDKLPENLIEVLPEKGQHIVTHSETGHHHVVDSQNTQLFRSAANDEGLQLFLVVNKDTELKHLRLFDTHESINLKPGNYQINRQEEYTPQGWRRVED